MTRIFTTEESSILSHVQVNIPFSWLMNEKARWLETFVENRINPEIGLDAEVLDSFTFKDFSYAARSFQSAGCRITIHGPFLDLSPGSTDNAIRSVTLRRMEQMTEAAEVFSPATVVCHAGYDASRYQFIRNTWYERAAEIWDRTAEKLAEKQICLMLENVYERHPKEIRELFAILKNNNTGYCLDVGHLSVFSSISLQNWLEILSTHIGQLHLHDNQGRSDEHLGMGEGNIDFTPLFEWMQGLEQPPVITLEPRNKEALKTSISYLRKIGPLPET